MLLAGSFAPLSVKIADPSLLELSLHRLYHQREHGLDKAFNCTAAPPNSVPERLLCFAFTGKNSAAGDACHCIWSVIYVRI